MSTWKLVLLMDNREFLNSKSDFHSIVKQRINSHFKGSSTIDVINDQYCESTYLVSGDYMFIARQIDPITKKTLQERVLDIVIERKNVDDLQQCLIRKSKSYKPLSFFEAQMYKLQKSGITKKIFLMEGDEDKIGDIYKLGDPGEFEKRRKRVKTMRNQILNGEWQGVEVECTRNKDHSVQYLIDQMTILKRQLDSANIPSKTMEEHKIHVNAQMKNATFQEYLRLRLIKGTGDKKAMKAIMDPEANWDKNFISPACTSKSQEYKSNLDDRATYYVSPAVGAIRARSNPVITTSSTSSKASTSRFKNVTPFKIDITPRSSLMPMTRRDLSGGSGLGLNGFQVVSTDSPEDNTYQKYQRRQSSQTKRTSSQLSSERFQIKSNKQGDEKNDSTNRATKKSRENLVQKQKASNTKLARPDQNNNSLLSEIQQQSVLKRDNIIDLLDSDDEVHTLDPPKTKQSRSVEIIVID